MSSKRKDKKAAAAVSDGPMPSAIFMIGGRGLEGDAMSTVDYLDSRNALVQDWFPSTPLPEARWAASAASWGGKVWVFGGNSDGMILNSAVQYDPHTDAWSEVPRMTSRRAHACSSGVGKKIYVCGGYGGEGGKTEPLDTVERFDPPSNTWEVVPKMNSKRFNAAMAVIGPLIHMVAGATDKERPLNTFERYDARENGTCAAGWEVGPTMRERRQGCGAASLQGMLFVCGGHNGVNCLQTGEFFQQSGKPWLEGGFDGAWTAMPKMSTPRYGLMALAAMSCDRLPKIYVFGGHNGSERLSSVEALTFDGEEWDPVPRQKESDARKMDARAGACVAGLMENEIPDWKRQQTSLLQSSLMTADTAQTSQTEQAGGSKATPGAEIARTSSKAADVTRASSKAA